MTSPFGSQFKNFYSLFFLDYSFSLFFTIFFSSKKEEEDNWSLFIKWKENFNVF